MPVLCFSMISEIFRGNWYLGIKTNTAIKIAQKMKWKKAVKSVECELETCNCGKLGEWARKEKKKVGGKT